MSPLPYQDLARMFLDHLRCTARLQVVENEKLINVERKRSDFLPQISS